MKSTSQIYKLYLIEVTKYYESRMIATYLHWFSPKTFLRKYSIKFLKSYMHLEDTNLYTGFCIRWRLHLTFSLSETPFQFGEIFKVTMIFKWTNSYCFTRPVILGLSFHCGMCLGSFPEDLILMLTKDSKIEKKSYQYCVAVIPHGRILLGIKLHFQVKPITISFLL